MKIRKFKMFESSKLDKIGEIKDVFSDFVLDCLILFKSEVNVRYCFIDQFGELEDILPKNGDYFGGHYFNIEIEIGPDRDEKITRIGQCIDRLSESMDFNTAIVYTNPIGGYPQSENVDRSFFNERNIKNFHSRVSKVVLIVKLKSS